MTNIKDEQKKGETNLEVLEVLDILHLRKVLVKGCGMLCQGGQVCLKDQGDLWEKIKKSLIPYLTMCNIHRNKTVEKKVSL